MHRSGTSIVSLTAQRLGIDLGGPGERSEHSPEGYGEDLEVLSLHRRMFEAAFDGPGDAAVGHHHDWGYDPAETFDQRCFAAIADEVDRLLDRDDGFGAWGWKDPRGTLVLDQWTQRLDDPRVLLVIRHPDDVAASMAKLGWPPFEDPVLAHRIWRFYNRRVLDFASRAEVPCAVVHGSVGSDPVALATVLREQLGIETDAARADIGHIHRDRYAAGARRRRIGFRDRLASERLWRRLARLAVSDAAGARPRTAAPFR